MASPLPRPVTSEQVPTPTRGQELRAFLLLTAVVAPAIAVAFVGGYGFVVWMVQLVVGPPSGH